MPPRPVAGLARPDGPGPRRLPSSPDRSGNASHGPAPRRAYRAGLIVALLLAAAVVVFYLVSPAAVPGTEGGTSLAGDLRAALDRARLWLAGLLGG